MFKKWALTTALLLTVAALLQPWATVSEAAGSGMTKYRVYQSDRPLKEFAKEAQAITYAKYYSYSHVETIADRKWVWDNIPRYKLYQNGKSNAKWEFRTYEQALAAAKSLSNAHIRDLQTIGWAYDNFPRFRLYQGDDPVKNSYFRTIEEAKKEAKNWSNAHIIDLNSNEWVWDNLTAAQVNAQSIAEPAYQIVVDGEAVPGVKIYTFLRNAIKASADYPGSEVVNIKTGSVIHSQIPLYDIRKDGKIIESHISLTKAVKQASSLYQAEVLQEGSVLWSGIPYLSIYEGDKKIRTVNILANAIALAKDYPNSSVRNADGRTLWSNAQGLVYLGWNGSSSSATIMSHVTGTQGLDIDSPTWFELEAADGSLKDNSDPALVRTLKERGIQTMPLVHNQFNRKMTSEFLSSKTARTKFIGALVGRLSELGAYGVNLDFEEVAGADRTAYTAFVKELTTAAHAKKLKVSIDLPRGSVSWNHLTAYDHAALADIVDTVIIMAYDEHWRGSDKAGSVASLPWVEEGIKQFLEYGIPRSKLMLGIPFYVREWRVDASGKLVDNRALFMKDLPRLIQDTGAQGVHDPASGQTKYTYQKDGYTHIFWAETHDTVLARIKLAQKYDLAGVAAWRLGYEDAELWTKMLRARYAS